MSERDLRVPSKWGETPTECPQCGNRDINRILLWYDVTYPGQTETATDAAPLATFIYERRSGARLSTMPVAIEKLTCLKCVEEGRPEVKIPIKPVGPYHD